MNEETLHAQKYFDKFEQASLQAIESAGNVEYKIRVGGKNLTIQFAGSMLERFLMPALSHLKFEFKGEADLTLQVWDDKSTGINAPAPIWQAPPNGFWKFQTPVISAMQFPETDNIIWLNREKKKAVYWLPDSASLRIVDRGSPLLALWTWWLADFGVQLTHGAALGGKKGAALLLGKGGSGKSTTALMSLNSPLQYLADDYCLVSASPAPKVYSLYSSGKVNAEDRDNFPWLEPAFQGMDHEKSLYQLGSVFKDRILAESPLMALFSCHISGQEETTIEKASPIEIMRAIAPSTIFQLRVVVDPSAAMRLLAEVARNVPCYRLNLGSDRNKIPDMLYDFLSR